MSHVKVTVGKPENEQITAVSGTSAAMGSAAGHVKIVRVYADVKIHVAWDEAATTTHTPVADHAPEYFKINQGEKLHFIKQSGEADGTVWTADVTQ